MQLAVYFMVIVAGLIFATHQGEKSVVVLIADPDGKVGQAEVATPAGKQLLSAANQMTTVTDPAKPPSAITVATPEFIEQNFAAALSSQPLPPVKFVLYFLPDSNDMDAESTALIPTILATIKQRNSFDVGIHGHSDRLGSEADNLRLSLSRATTIKEILLQQGVSGDHLEVTSHGEGNPLVATPDEVAEPRNRRVEVVVR